MSEWYGVLPSGWQDRYLSQTCDEQCNKNTGNIENNVLSLSYGQIIRKKNKYGGLTPTDFATYQIVEPGNIILRLTDLQNDHTSLRTGLVRERGIITSAYCCLKPWESPEYLQYLLHAYDTQKYFYGLGGGVRQSIGLKDIRYIHLPLPPRPEQDQIVRYLDWKVSQINRLINAKKKQIGLLQEQKRAVVNAVMTKGLNPDVPMKDSGIEWLGEVPEHWNNTLIGHLFGIILGKMLQPTASKATDTLECYFCAKDVHYTGIDTSDMKRMWFSPAEKAMYKVQSGDLLVVEGGAGAGGAFVYEGDLQDDYYIQNSIMILRPKNNDNAQYVYYWLLSFFILYCLPPLLNILSKGGMPLEETIKQKDVIVLTEEQKELFIQHLKAGIYKELYQKDLLSDAQLGKLLIH